MSKNRTKDIYGTIINILNSQGYTSVIDMYNEYPHSMYRLIARIVVGIMNSYI